MSRLPIASTLASLGLLVACDGFDIYNHAPYASAQISDAFDGSDSYAPNGNDVATLAGGIIGLPSVLCGDQACVASGRGSSSPLVGRDAVRAAYYDVMGYPNDLAFNTHTVEGHDLVTYDGVWASGIEQIRSIGPLLNDAGYIQCSDLPETLRHHDLPDGILDVGPGNRVVPDRFADAGKVLDRRVSVYTEANDLVATIDFSCEIESGYFDLDYEDGLPHRTVGWFSVAQDDDGVDIELISTIGPVNHAASLAIRSAGVEGTLVRTFKDEGREYGLRTVLTVDAEERVATAFQYELVSPSLWEDSYATKHDLKVEPGARVLCAPFTGTDLGEDGECDELPLPEASDLSFEPGTELTLDWAGAPEGESGLRDHLVVPD